MSWVSISMPTATVKEETQTNRLRREDHDEEACDLENSRDVHQKAPPPLSGKRGVQVSILGRKPVPTKTHYRPQEQQYHKKTKKWPRGEFFPLRVRVS